MEFGWHLSLLFQLNHLASDEPLNDELAAPCRPQIQSYTEHTTHFLVY